MSSRPQAATAQPAAGQPVVPQPAVPQPAVPQPVVPHSAVAQSAVAQSAVGQDAIGQYPADQPAAADRVDQIQQDRVDQIQQAWERERPGTPASSIGVVTRIWRIGKLLADERRRTLARLGIDAATLDLLSTLRRAGDPYRLTAGEIADLALVSAGAISQRLTRAERAGLVRRERSDPDGRLTYVTLTAAGHALIECSVDELFRHEESLLAPLTREQRSDLSGLLRILLCGLTDSTGS